MQCVRFDAMCVFIKLDFLQYFEYFIERHFPIAHKNVIENDNSRRRCCCDTRKDFDARVELRFKLLVKN